ncbi:MAG: carboxypeptidase regulatory-like domain-containing protein [Planctomycetota bacterium]|nr:carboxypeptidase regulatory-like domain-containing protein [Planctomycetota bacterium]
MRIGYVSDENYVALDGVSVAIRNVANPGESETLGTHSLADGSVHADLVPGEYEFTLARTGFGGKRLIARVEPLSPPISFRLLSESLLGYAWPKWITEGNWGEFRVHSKCAYHLSLWRYGWRKTLVEDLGWFDDHGPSPTLQLLPEGDFTQTGVRWNQTGYGSAWHRQKQQAPLGSGLYYYHVRNERGEFFSFPWIVQPAQPRTAICVLTSNVTWNAYNSYGGRSNYVNQRELLARPTVHARTDLERYTAPGTWPFEEYGAPLSFDRPEPANSIPEQAEITDVIHGRLACAYAPGEWRLLGWLEREGFAYDLYSETELHFGRIPLDQYRVVVLNTHNEYVSKEMYFALKNWVHQRGGRLMYLAGCGFLCEFEFLDETKIRCRQEERHDLRGESEACLLGVAYSHDGYRSGAPYRVVDETHWAFAGTGLRNGDVFGTKTLNGRTPGGASGLELDKISPHSPSNIRHLAKGMNPNQSGADCVYYDTKSGGAVFSVGSLNWTLSCPVDDAVSRITANVLRRFLGTTFDGP